MAPAVGEKNNLSPDFGTRLQYF